MKKLKECADLEHPEKADNLTAYLTTAEASEYIRKSVSWLLRQPGIPYLPGRPNLYKRSDLDRWYEREKFKPRVA